MTQNGPHLWDAAAAFPAWPYPVGDREPPTLTDDLFRAAFDAWPAPEAILAVDGVILVVNTAWRRTAELAGATSHVGTSYLDVCDAAAAPGNAGSPDDRTDGAAVGAGLRDVLAGRIRRFDHTYRCDVPGGPPRWSQLTAAAVAAPGRGARLVHTDVTDREQLQGDVRARSDQLARSHRELQAITENLGDGVCRIDGRGRVTYLNARGRHLLRLETTAALGGRALHWLTPADHALAIDIATTDAAVRPTPVEATLRGADGSTLPIEYLATPLSPAVPGPRDWVVVFRDITDRHARDAALAAEIDTLRWRQRIRDALDDDGLVLHAQPIVELSTGTVVHHELLVRMRDVTDPSKLHPPGRFIPIAEAGGLAPRIDRWVIGEAIQLAAGGHHLHINLSARSLGDSSLPDDIGRWLAEADVPPGRLVFEVTETALLDDVAAARRCLERLHDLGCGLALDDFGTGYGGFTYLKQLPLDALKIDIEFVRDLVSSPASRHVVDAIVSLARAFGLRTVAEGVEDVGTLAVLRAAGVDWAQGYLFGRPVPLATTALQERVP